MQQDSFLRTKLCIPPIRPQLVSRPRLIERLNEGLHRKLTLISAPAGLGKTPLVLTGYRRRDEFEIAEIYTCGSYCALAIPIPIPRTTAKLARRTDPINSFAIYL
jgi:hypothetical protein